MSSESITGLWHQLRDLASNNQGGYATLNSASALQAAGDVAAAGGSSAASTIPENAQSTLAVIRSTGAAPDGYQGGGSFANDGRGGGQVLPSADAEGKAITYREWDVNPKVPGQPRGPQRLVTGSDGNAYYTGDHYQTFTKVPE